MDEEIRDQLSENEPTEEKPDDKSISADLIRGHINTIILRSLYDGDKYGYEIIAEIERKSHGQYAMKQPSLYSALKRLESQGYITSYWGGSVAGGRRKYFSLTEEGREISERNQAEWEYSRTVIDSLISDKAFDFTNPAPTAVDMRVLKRSTTRVPLRGDEEEEETEEDRQRAEAAVLQERERMLAELHAKEEAFEEECRRTQEELAAQQRALTAEREALEALKAEHAQLLEEQATFNEQQRERELHLHQETALRMDELREREEILLREKSACERKLQDKEQMLIQERVRYEQLIAEREQWLAEERMRHAHELEEHERRVREEQAQEFAIRERQLLHRNYINLVNAPPPQPTEEASEYSYYTPPVAEETPPAQQSDTVLYTSKPEAEREYRTIIQKLYTNTLRTDPLPETHEVEQETYQPEPRPQRAQSLGRIDFYDLEARAAQDGIRINTAGGEAKPRATRSESIVHKGKALFLSAIVAFVLCLAEGSVVLALMEKLTLPLFYPYFIWAVGLSALLITGLAYANHYGERALRRTGNTLLTCIVIYILLVIFTLILGLAIKIDFNDINQLATYVIIPCVFFFNIVAFAIVYVLQIKPKRK